jgi:hypothetical protein
MRALLNQEGLSWVNSPEFEDVILDIIEILPCKDTIFCKYHNQCDNLIYYTGKGLHLCSLDIVIIEEVD